MSKIEQVQDQGQFEAQKEETIYQLLNNVLICTFQTVFGYICLDLCVAISLHYISGEIGTIANSGYGFALNCINILILPIGFGLNQSLNMHTSQALGDKKIQLSKRFFNINLYVMLISLIPLGATLLAIVKYPLSLTINPQDRQATSDYALEFLFYLIPAIVLALEYESAKIFMIAHKVTYPFIFIHFITMGLHWFFSWLFMVQFKWKVAGAGSVIILTEIFNIIGLLLFIQFTNIKQEVFQGTSLILDIPRFKRLGVQYIKTSIPIVLHIYSEFFVFFLMSFIALSLGTAEMNAHLGIQSLSGIFFRVPISLSIALMSYIGTEMGRRNVKKAKIYVAIGLFLIVLTTSVCSIVLWFCKKQLASFYISNDVNDVHAPRSKELFIDTIPWLIFGMIIVDGLQGTLSGALKGINKVNLVFSSTLIAYYIFCIPIVSYFTYSWGLDQGIVGIWQGFGISNLLLVALFIGVLFTTNWEIESMKIVKRVKHENELQSSTLLLQDEIVK